MTFLLRQLSNKCPWDNEIINPNTRRGNGTDKFYCNKSCYGKMYIFERWVGDISGMHQLLDGKFEETGELSKDCHDFIVLALEYMKLGLPAVFLNPHFQAIRKGKCCTLKTVLLNTIEREKEKLGTK